MILAASPLLTRLFSPEDFGIFAVFGISLGLLGGLSCMKYENALPLARDEAEAANIFVLCGLILGVFFMATDMVTSPVTGKGMLIFGFGCGLITVLIRLFGGYPEGVSFAILLMNAATPLIDRFTRPKIFGYVEQEAAK